MEAIQTSNPSRELRAITSFLRERGARYFRESNHVTPDVRLYDSQERHQSRIYWFELRAAGQTRLLRVKMPLYCKGLSSSNEHPHLGQRPLRFPLAEPETKFELEYSALSAIHNYFHHLRDPRFGTVRILDSLPDIRANVMEEISEPSLLQLFGRENRLQALWSSAMCDAAFRNAGAWLRTYHSLPKQANARHTGRAEFIESIKSIADYLESKLADSPFFLNTASLVTAVALEALPQSLPVGLGHGDYAMRNILVGPGGRVTVLDTLARWRTAVYEDIGFFLTNLKLSWPQVISQGLAYKPNLISRYERRFLDGYFESGPIPIRAIRLYEIQALLDKWSGSVVRFEKKLDARHVGVRDLRRAVENRYFKRSMGTLLKAIR